ncbi:MAG: DUF2461 family protein [Solirubrobacteraceae bacterium]
MRPYGQSSRPWSSRLRDLRRTPGPRQASRGTSSCPCSYGQDSLKTVPKGYPSDHPRAELLRHRGLTAWREWPPAPWLCTAAAKTRIVDFLRHCQSLTDWLSVNVGPSD